MAAEVRTVRQRLPVPGAWAYGVKGDQVVVVTDGCGREHLDSEECERCYTDEEVAQLVELVKLKLSFSDDGQDHAVEPI